MTDCNKEPDVDNVLGSGADMSLELVIGLTGIDTGADVVVVSGTRLNTSSGMNVGLMSGTLIVVGIVICCGVDCEEEIERSMDHCSEGPELGIRSKTNGFRFAGLSKDGKGWELSNEFVEGSGRDTGVAMGNGGNDK